MTDTPETDGIEEAASKATSWLPIESAPKDKVEILAWSKRHGLNVGTLTHYKRPEMPSRKGGWFQPSHWMPVPPAPGTRAATATSNPLNPMNDRQNIFALAQSGGEKTTMKESNSTPEAKEEQP